MALTNKLWKLWSIEHYIWQCCDNLTSTNLQIPPEYSLSSVYFAIQHIFLKGILFNLKCGGPFTLRSLTRHKTRSNFPHASHWHRTHCDLIQLHNSTFWSWNKDETNKPTEDLFFLFKKSCVTFECTWNPLLCLLDLVQRWQSPPYGCHSLNSYNICLCQTTEFIQCINNETMATFHSATRLWAQWNTVKAFKAFFVCWMNRPS